MSEQTKINTINDSNNIYTYLHILVLLLLRNKTFNPIHKQYGINYNCITLLISCYFYDKYVKHTFKISNISLFTGYYTAYKTKKYIDQLIELGFIIPLVGNSYQITDKINIILKEITKSYENVLYNFCSLHNIDL